MVIIIWGLILLSLALWIPGLVFAWGIWIWVFFVVALIALIVQLLTPRRRR